MVIDCDVSPGLNGICVSRSIPERHLYAGCLLYGFGSVPSIDAAFDNGIQRAVSCVAGSVTNALEYIIQNETYSDYSQVAQHMVQTLKSTSNKLWSINQSVGQGIYVGGVLAWFSNLQYIALSFGGAALLMIKGHNAVRVGDDDGLIIYDAVGSRAGWTGKVYQGTLLPGEILLGAIKESHDWRQLQQQMNEFTVDAMAENMASVLRQYIAAPNEAAAVIEFRAK